MWNIILLGLVSLLTDVSSEMIYPLVPLYLVSKLGATPAIVGIIEGIAESLASLLKVFSGAASDKSEKRKPLAIFGYGFSGLSKILIIASGSCPGCFGAESGTVYRLRLLWPGLPGLCPGVQRTVSVASFRSLRGLQCRYRRRRKGAGSRNCPGQPEGHTAGTARNPGGNWPPACIDLVCQNDHQ